MSYSIEVATIVLHMYSLPASLHTAAGALVQTSAILPTFYGLDYRGSLLGEWETSGPLLAHTVHERQPCQFLYLGRHSCRKW
jgi:hypothetical protein